MPAFTHVLCSLDLSPTSVRVLRYAAATAQWYGARLTVVHVYPELSMADVIPPLTAVSTAATGSPRVSAERLRTVAEQLIAREVPASVSVELHMPEESDAATEIAAEAAAVGADLLVMGCGHRHGYERLLHHSVSESVVAAAPCSMVLIPDDATRVVPPGDSEFSRMLCPVDFSPGALSAVATAVLLAEDADARLTLLNVLDAPPVPVPHGNHDAMVLALHAEDTAARLRRLRALVPATERTFCHVETRVEDGRTAAEILRVADELQTQLIVMSARHRGPLVRWVFGSTTRDVLHGAACPVFIVPDPHAA